MRGDWGQERRDRERKKSSAFRASVAAVNSDGSYQIRREDTGVTVKAQRGDISLALSIGQVVTAMRTDMSGATAGSGYVILAPVTTNSLSASLAHRFTDNIRNVTQTVSIIKVAGVIVQSITLQKGGAVITALIYGENLTTAPTYGDAGITNHVAPVVTSALITVQVKASAGMAVGRYSLTVAGVVMSNFFEVVP